jgi:hypothetical protein
MNIRQKIVISVVAVIAVGAVLNAFGAIPAEGASSRPQYATPANVNAFPFGDTTGEVVFNTVKYADFYMVDLSTSKKMTHPTHVVTDTPDVNAVDLTGLEPDTTYYVTVEVSSSRGESLSHDSKVASFRTDPATP